MMIFDLSLLIMPQLMFDIYVRDRESSVCVWVVMKQNLHFQKLIEMFISRSLIAIGIIYVSLYILLFFTMNIAHNTIFFYLFLV